MDIERGLRIPVYGLGCGGAGATAIERDLAAMEGVVSAYVNPATETAYVDYDPAGTDAWALARTIERAGYGAGAPVRSEGSAPRATPGSETTSMAVGTARRPIDVRRTTTHAGELDAAELKD